MTTIVTRTGKGAPLSTLECDANFTNLNTDKIEGQIGTNPDEVPVSGLLGGMAFQSPESVVIKPQASAAPTGIGEAVFQLTSNTSLEIKVKGSDGTVRSVALTLA